MEQQVSTHSALMIALVSGLISGALAVGSNIWLQRQRLKDEAKTRALTQLSSRGEELYTLIARSLPLWDDRVRRARLVYGHDRDEFARLLAEAGDHIERVEYLVHVYFPDLKDHGRALRAAADGLLQSLSLTGRGQEEVDSSHHEQAMHFKRIAEEFRASLTEALRGIEREHRSFEK